MCASGVLSQATQPRIAPPKMTMAARADLISTPLFV